VKYLFLHPWSFLSLLKYGHSKNISNRFAFTKTHSPGHEISLAYKSSLFNDHRGLEILFEYFLEESNISIIGNGKSWIDIPIQDAINLFEEKVIILFNHHFFQYRNNNKYNNFNDTNYESPLSFHNVLLSDDEKSDDCILIIETCANARVRHTE
jgi:hypothetical protein